MVQFYTRKSKGGVKFSREAMEKPNSSHHVLTKPTIKKIKKPNTPPNPKINPNVIKQRTPQLQRTLSTLPINAMRANITRVNNLYKSRAALTSPSRNIARNKGVKAELIAQQNQAQFTADMAAAQADLPPTQELNGGRRKKRRTHRIRRN
jgi:hypothetical protein